MLTAIRRLRAADDGITLVELVVTMSLMTIVSALALAFFVGSSTTSNATTESGLTSANARNAMQSWVQLLQLADQTSSDSSSSVARLVSLTPTAITLNANLTAPSACSNGSCPAYTPTQVELFLRQTTGSHASGQLAQTLTSSSGASTVVQVPSGAAASGSCLFTAYASDGTRLGCQSLSSSQLASVARVDIGFTVTTDTGTTQTYASSAVLPGSTT